MGRAAVRLSHRETTTLEVWQEHYSADPQALFTQSPIWASIWDQASAGRIRPAPELIRFDDGSSAVLALCREDVGNRSVVRSSPAGTYGGWVGTGLSSTSHVEQLALAMLSHDDIVWRSSPFVDLPADLRRANVESDETYLIDLSDGPDQVISRTRAKQRNTARRAERLGVHCAIADGREAWQDYYQLYRASLTRWGDAATVEHPAQLFDALAARRAEGVELWLASMGDRAVSGAILLRGKRHTAYWHGSASEEGLSAGATPHLLLNIIKDECGRGTHWFDFNPSGGLADVSRFKVRMGATERSSPIIRRTPRTPLRTRLLKRVTSKSD